MANSIAWVLSKLRFPLAVALGGTGKDTTAGLLTDLKTAGAYAKDNIVGAVSQTAGVPTGSIVQSGVSGTHSWVRYADGTQINWGSVTPGVIAYNAVGSLFAANSPVITYPVPFITGNPVFNLQIIAAGADVWATGGQSGQSLTSVPAVLLMAPTGGSRNTIILYTAHGRWY